MQQDFILSKWKRLVSKGKKTLSKVGRPQVVDEVEEDKVLNKIKVGIVENKGITKL